MTTVSMPRLRLVQNGEGGQAATDPTVPPPKPIPRMRGRLRCTKAFHEDQIGFISGAHARYGDVVEAPIVTMNWYFVRDPAIINEINVTRWAEFYKPKLAKRLWKLFLGNGLVPNDGESWKRQHKLIMPAFHKLRIDGYGAIMTEYTRRMISRYQEGEPRDVHRDMTALTLAVVGRTLFDADVEGDAKTVGDAMVVISEMLVEHINMPLPLPRWWPSAGNRRKMRAIGDMERVIRSHVQARRTEGRDHGDLMSHLVFVTDDEGSAMTERQLRDEMMTLFFAGHETTAGVLTWAWWLLATHPDKLATLREELDRVVGRAPIRVEDLPNLPYLEKVVKESLRLQPSVWCYMREATKDLRMGDYVFKRGRPILISPYILGRDPRLHPNPLRYEPERWTREYERGLPRGAYVPFAAGPRVCLGKQFAMMELRLIIGTLVQLLELNVPDGFTPDFVQELSLHPGERGIPMTVRHRPS
ncbi:MAG: cytochrome P450 [Myxococcales bacterium]|nr:cytochrome P450 [Myxococcales bacterium]